MAVKTGRKSAVKVGGAVAGGQPKRSKSDQMLAGKPASDKPQMHLFTQEFAAPELAGIRTLWVEAVAPGLTPQRLASILKAAEDGNPRDYLTLAEDMEERELHYISVLGTRKLAIGGVKPIVEPAGEDARSAEIASAVEDLIKAPAFKLLVEHLTDALGKGFACPEIIWATSKCK
jgi:phage gp29-like protein